MTRGLAMVVLAGAGCAARPVVPPPVVRPAPEWAAVFDRSEGWIGGDGAATVDLDDRVLWTFGDSGVGSIKDGAYAPGSTLVNNAVAIQPARPRAGERRPPAPDEISFAWGPPTTDGKPTALFTPPRPGEWYWPTGGGYLVPGHQKLFLFMSRLFRPREHDDGVWNFEGRGSDMLVIDRPGPDPRAWKPQVVPTPGAVGADLKPPARRITWGTSVDLTLADASTAIYIYGVDTTDPFNKKALVAAVADSEAGDTSRWRFWKGPPGEVWSADVRDAAPIAEHVTDEFSVTGFYEGMPWGAPQPYILVHSEELLGRHIMARTARSPTGPWSAPRAIYECPEPLGDARTLVYSAKAHRELSDPGELLVSYCVNSTDFWFMLAHATLYRPRFVRVPLSLLPEAPSP